MSKNCGQEEKEKTLDVVRWAKIRQGKLKCMPSNLIQIIYKRSTDTQIKDDA